MLITTKNILHRFSENLEWAMEVDIATAWATYNDGLLALRDKAKGADPDFKVRVVVGVRDYLTKPEALRLLQDMYEKSELRIRNEEPLFHPKVYIFRNETKSIAWVGSSNFTRRGFKENEELVLETSDTEHIQDVKKWFDDLWDSCGPIPVGAINKYKKEFDEHEGLRKANPSPQPSPPKPARSNNRLELLKTVSDWKSYTDALYQCHKLWWEESDYKYSVLGKSYSWYHTIRELHDVVRKDWTTLDNDDGRRLLGLVEENEGVWALLGRMSYRNSPQRTVFQQKDNRQLIRSAIMMVIDANDDDFPEVAIKAYKATTNLQGVGPGIATRLLALARPDRIVSLNSASQKGLGEFCNLAPTTLGHPKNYQRILEKLYESAWFNEPTPKNSCEHAIWSMRAALIDCFVYDPRAR